MGLHGLFQGLLYLLHGVLYRRKYNSSAGKRVKIYSSLFQRPVPVMSQDSSVGIATGYGLDGRGRIFLFCTASRPAPGPTQPPTEWVSRLFPPGIKRKGRDLVLRSKMVDLYFYSPYVFMA
jgi:hypothetical protein